MRLLVIDCEHNEHTTNLLEYAKSKSPKPEAIASLTIDVEKFSRYRLRQIANELSPDLLVFFPPFKIKDMPSLITLIKELIRQTEISSGRFAIISSNSLLLKDLSPIISALTSRCYIISTVLAAPGKDYTEVLFDIMEAGWYGNFMVPQEK